ncbi:MAG: hypothetical protein Q8K32_17710 [Archangium sp.]|nr:hypothetical protein [Archangium sp.]
MSDELEARLAAVQKELAQVQRAVADLKEQVEAPDPLVERLTVKVAAQLEGLNEKKEAFAELEAEMNKLREEAAQVEGAAENL